MKYRRAMALVAAAAVIASGALVGGTATAKPKPVVVGTDPAGDWGSNQDPTLGPIGGPLGQDVVKAEIAKADAKTLNFIITLASLPPNGGLPEGTRYTWHMVVGGNYTELDGKWSNYSRGACDPTAGSCPPPRDPGMQPFVVRGNCTSDQVVICEEVGIVQATFDPGAATITIPVPLALLKAKAGTQISHGVSEGSTFSGVSAAPSAFYSHATLPYDTLTMTKTYVVPR